MEAVVYDTVLEETGGSDGYERRIGRVRFVESISLVVSSLIGGWVAGMAGARVTYFLTVPFALLSIVAYLRFREPLLHRLSEPTSLRDHFGVTIRILTRRRRLLPIITLAALSAVTLQLIFEFGPLWLVAVAVPALFYGPYWAGLVSTLGLGGILVGWIRLDRPTTSAAAGTAMTAAALVLTSTGSVLVVTLAQIVLALAMVAIGIHVSRLLHDEIPSAVRTGVASGVSALSWIVFLHIALGFGLIRTTGGLPAAGWFLVVLAALTGALLTATALRQRSGRLIDDGSLTAGCADEAAAAPSCPTS